ncbi:MAG: class II aldolase/adducin family protein [Actinomycetaceae bacterium]
MSRMSTDEVAAHVAELSRVGTVIVSQGLALASGGNLSVLLDDGEHMLLTGKGTWLDRLGPESFSLLRLDGTVVDGATPSSEWKLHARMYEVRPETRAVVHVHPQYALLLTSIGKKIRFITQDHAFYVGSYGYTPYFANGSDELADTAAEQMRSGEHPVVVLGNHGISAVGESLGSAFRRALNFEEAAAMTYRAELLGDTDSEFPADKLAELRHQ